MVLFLLIIDIVDPWSCFYRTSKLLTLGLVFMEHWDFRPLVLFLWDIEIVDPWSCFSISGFVRRIYATIGSNSWIVISANSA